VVRFDLLTTGKEKTGQLLTKMVLKLSQSDLRYQQNIGRPLGCKGKLENAIYFCIYAYTCNFKEL